MVNIDKITNTIAQPDVWLCHRNYDKICLLSPIADLKIYVTANAVDEVSFTLHKYNNGVEFPYWDKIKDLKVVCVDGFGYFEIAVDKNVADDTKKVITGVSIEAELGQITVDGLEINGEVDRNNKNNWDDSGAYIKTVIYNSSDTSHSLLHRLMSYAPHWKLGDIKNTCPTITTTTGEESVSEAKRTFSFDGTNVYDALQEIATELDVVFVFNTVERSVSMYDLNKIGEDTTIYVSTENLATDFTCTSNKDSIKNCFKILGGDDKTNNAVRTVNPNGSNYIFYFSPEQMEDMPDSLVTRLNEYEEFSDSKQDKYNQCCEDLYDAIDNKYYLETSMMPNTTPADTTKEAEIAKLTSAEIGTIPVADLTSLYETGAKKAILTIAQVMVDYRYEVTIKDGSVYDSSAHTWTGKFKVTNTSDTTDSAISPSDVTLTFVEDEKEYLQDKIDELVGAIDIEDDIDITAFKEKLKEYSLDNLDQFKTCYEECANILVEKGYANKSEAEANTEFYQLYYSYYEKAQACNDEFLIRQAEVDAAQKEVDDLTSKVKEYQEELNFENYLGETLYKEFCLYRREDTYQNDNYISDGQDNSQLLQNAQKLVEVATKELIKASLFQTVYSANLNNLFTNPIYEPFYDYFDLFNWIHAEIDGKQILLRLIGITFDFSSIEKIEVEFSEQVRNANGITDLQSILGQAKSMATSYSSTVKQAASGQEACLEFDTIKQEGLNSALMNIKNSNNEEVVIDNCGINCRSKDQNDQYDKCQLRITGKNIVMTDDDWRTARLAIGKIFVNYDSDGDGIKEPHEEYGIVADCIIGEMIIGETLLVANSSGTFLVDKDGIIVKNMKLDMSNADGSRRIVIDPELDSILSVYTNSKQVFYVDTNGNMCMLGNLYVNNNNMYLKVDMTAENIIEVGYGEITGTGNEGEAGSGEGGGVNTGNYVDTPWYRSSEGLNIISLYDGGFSTTTNSSDVKKITHNKLIEKDGNVYFIEGYNLKKFNKQSKKWDTISTLSTYTPVCFVRTNRDDNNLYVCSEYYSNYRIHQFNLDDSKWSIVCVLHGSTSDYTNYLHDVFMDGTMVHLFGISADYSNKYYTLGTEDSRGALAWTGVAPNNTFIHRVIPYNDELYGIYINGSDYSSSLGKITDLETRTIKFISALDSNCNSCYNFNQYCYTIMNEKLYIFSSFASNNKCYIYDFKSEQVSEVIDAPPLECYYNDSYNFNSGVCSFNDGDNIHLYNGVLVNRGASVPYGGDTWYAKFDIGYIAHYIYNENNTSLVNRNFKELDNGKNFRISMQNEYIAVDEIIYEIECDYLYRPGQSTKKYDTHIRKLDTSNSI